MASGTRLIKSRLKQDETTWSLGLFDGFSPCLDGLKDSALVSFTGSRFHNLVLDRKMDSSYVLVLQYGALYLYWWPLLAEPKS